MSTKPLVPLELTDEQIVACAGFTAPDGATFLELPAVLSFVQTFTANAQPVEDLELGTFPSWDFVVCSVEYTGVTPGTIVQIQWPDGRYLMNPGIDAFSFIGTGKRGRLVDPEKLLRKQSKIRINVDNSNVGESSTVELYFYGYVRVPFAPAANGQSKAALNG